ncbi:flagellar hook-length control protein FliK [Oscillospiraceae bacterium OttesenSCG-928-F05]|nr:flagellar hook-length control protein FliK [Oscillospiraceae bacterium OttesenSCG-928-F05]
MHDLQMLQAIVGGIDLIPQMQSSRKGQGEEDISFSTVMELVESGDYRTSDRTSGKAGHAETEVKRDTRKDEEMAAAYGAAAHNPRTVADDTAQDANGDDKDVKSLIAALESGDPRRIAEALTPFIQADGSFDIAHLMQSVQTLLTEEESFLLPEGDDGLNIANLAELLRQSGEADGATLEELLLGQLNRVLTQEGESGENAAPEGDIELILSFKANLQQAVEGMTKPVTPEDAPEAEMFLPEMPKTEVKAAEAAPLEQPEAAAEEIAPVKAAESGNAGEGETDEAPTGDSGKNPAAKTADFREVYTPAQSPFQTAEVQAQPQVQSAQPVSPAQVLDQLVQSATLNSQNGVQKMEIMLAPEFLGKVSIVLTATEDGVTAMIRAANDSVRNMLAMNIAELQQGLKDAGINMKNIEIEDPELSWDFARDGSSQSDKQPQDTEAAARIARLARFSHEGGEDGDSAESGPMAAVAAAPAYHTYGMTADGLAPQGHRGTVEFSA